jgi:hypothetical protein
MAAKVVPFEMKPQAFLERVRKLSASSANVIFLPHARERMRKRRITTDQVLEVLRRGSIAPGENPAPDIYGNWKATLRKNVAGDEVKVAAALDKSVVVITVY